MDLEKRLAANAVFATLSPEERCALLNLSRTRHLQKGEFLTLAGDLWPYLFWVVEGVISAIKESAEGRSLVAISFGAGEVFWGVAFFSPSLRMPVSLRVDAPAQVRLWSREQLLPLILSHGSTSWELCCLMLERMLRASEIIETLAFQPVAGRLAKLLVEFSESKDQARIARTMTLDEIAARIGTTREVVCRFLHRFSDEGIIDITRTEFVVTDHARLNALAQQEKWG